MPSTRSGREQLEDRTLTTSRLSSGNSPYSPLPSNTIRLFHLSKGSRGSEISGKLEVVHLSNCSEYKAVSSYIWGDENQPTDCVIKFNNNQTLSISQTLNCLLLSLRNILKEKTPLLWIDQICINQSDETEKKHQIGHTRQIYSGADEVLVWLRDESDNDKISLAIQTAKILHSHEVSGGTASPQNSHSQDLNDAEYTGDSFEQTSSVAGNGLSALLSLWCHPWFKRLWVRQEVMLAKQATFCSGGHAIGLKQLAIACDVHCKAAESLLFSGTELSQWMALRQETARSYLQLTYSKEFFDLIPEKAPEKIYLQNNLLDIFRYTFNLEAENKCDRVYAIYHLSSAASNQNFWPNSSKPLPQLWRELAAYFLNDHTSWNSAGRGKKRKKRNGVCPAVILALSATQENLESRNSTSWVPDFGELGLRSAIKFDHYYYYSKKFTAGGSSEFRPIIDQDGNGTLTLKGVVWSQVRAKEEDTQQPPVGGSSVPPEFDSAEYWNFITEKLVPWYAKCHRFGRKDTHRNFAALLSQGLELRADMKSPNPKQHEEDAFPTKVPDFPSFSAKVRDTLLAGEERIDMEELHKDLFPFIANVAWGMDTRDWKRVLAKLSRGPGRVGWVPQTAEIDDYVVLIQGAPFPFVVRQNHHNSLYKMIGDAYIGGIMEGEGWKNKTSPVQEFEFE